MVTTWSHPNHVPSEISRAEHREWGMKTGSAWKPTVLYKLHVISKLVYCGVPVLEFYST